MALKFEQINGEDGLTHINVYSKGKTKLGRLLSNFAHTPFVLHDLWETLEFASVEGYWYWFKTGIDKFRSLHGAEAKRLGKAASQSNREPSRDELEQVYRAKLRQHPSIAESLAASSLPLAHYYVYGGQKVNADKYLWTVELWEKLRSEL